MRVLVIAAHPDDPEFFAGGTIARWCAEGHTVHYLIATGGEKGSDCSDVSPEQLRATRQEEQRRAAALLGVQHVHFLDFTDGELMNTLEVRRALVRFIRSLQPDAVLTLDPLTWHYGGTRINHTDHRTIGAAACDAIFPASGNPLYFPELLREGFAPYTPKQVFFAGAAQPTLLMDVTAFVEQKLAAICAHQSQVTDPQAVRQRVLRAMLRRLADGRVCYVEALRCVWLA